MEENPKMEAVNFRNVSITAINIWSIRYAIAIAVVTIFQIFVSSVMWERENWGRERIELEPKTEDIEDIASFTWIDGERENSKMEDVFLTYYFMISANVFFKEIRNAAEEAIDFVRWTG